MKTEFAICATFVACLLGLIPGAGAAESEPGNICLADPICAEQLSRAANLSRNKQLPEALAAYVAAYERRPYTPILFNIARVHHRLGQLDKAAQYYQRFIDAAPPDAAEQIDKARGYLEQAKKEGATAVATSSDPPGSATDPKPDAKPEIKASPVEPTPTPAPEKAAGSLDPSRAPLVLSPQKNDRPPFYRRNWFWGLVGGVIGGATVGIIVGIVLRPRSLPDYATTIRFITPTGTGSAPP